MKDIDSKYTWHVFICHGSKCTKNGADSIRQALRKDLKSQGIKAKVTKTSCQSLCKHGCIVFLQGKGEHYAWQDVSSKDVDDIISKL